MSYYFFAGNIFYGFHALNVEQMKKINRNFRSIFLAFCDKSEKMLFVNFVEWKAFFAFQSVASLLNNLRADIESENEKLFCCSLGKLIDYGL